MLYRLQNVNISTDDCATEFWSVYEIFKDNQCVERELRHEPTNTNASFNTATATGSTTIISDFVVNAEHELYVKGTTAVWTKGVCEEKDGRLSRTCFTCETPIQHAFFCSPNFIKNDNPDKRKREKPDSGIELNEQPEFGICLIDSKTLRVYLPNGEDFITSLEFSVAHVWSTNQCILLERNVTSTNIGAANVMQLPRLFSLTHPLNEMAPVLIRSNSGTVTFFIDNDYKLVFAVADCDLVMLYDNKIGKHFVALLRKATAEEKQSVAGTFIKN